MTSALLAQSVERPPILQRMSFAVRPGEIVGLVGPNGSGKTTLLRAIAGLTRGGGQIHLNGEAFNPKTHLGQIAYMPSVRRIDWPMRVRDVVALGLMPVRAPDTGAVDRALVLADAIELAERAVDKLSTGERARILLARAIVASPRYLLLDEPIANLDPYYQLAILAALRAEADRGAGILVVLHDLPLAERHCDRLLLLDRGHLLAEGRPTDVLSDKHLAQVFRIRRRAEGWECT